MNPSPARAGYGLESRQSQAASKARPRLQPRIIPRKAAETFDGDASLKGLFLESGKPLQRTALDDIAEEQTFERQERIGYVNYELTGLKRRNGSRARRLGKPTKLRSGSCAGSSIGSTNGGSRLVVRNSIPAEAKWRFYGLAPYDRNPRHPDWHLQSRRRHRR